MPPTAPAARPWSTLLQGAPDALSVAPDHPRPAELGPEVDAVPVPLDDAVVRRLAATTGADAATVLLAAWRALLWRTTDEPDLVIGCGRAA